MKRKNPLFLNEISEINLFVTNLKFSTRRKRRGVPYLCLLELFSFNKAIYIELKKYVGNRCEFFHRKYLLRSINIHF